MTFYPVTIVSMKTDISHRYYLLILTHAAPASAPLSATTIGELDPSVGNLDMALPRRMIGAFPLIHFPGRPA